MDELARSQREVRRWKLACAVIAAVAIAGIIGPRALEAQQPRPKMEYRLRGPITELDLKDHFREFENNGWEIFQVMPVVTGPGQPAVTGPAFRILARRPSK